MIQEIKGNIWVQECDALCVTTNGTVKRNGRAVMGRGVALEARNKFMNIDLILGQEIVKYGNIVNVIWRDPFIYSFPVKHDWRDKADLNLIKKSMKEIIFNTFGTGRIIIPRPGCGNGGLDWGLVKKALLEVFEEFKIGTSDRFWFIDRS